MTRLLVAGAAALALAQAPALAQNTSATEAQSDAATMAGDRQVRQNAARSAQNAGVRNPRVLPGVFVPEGSAPAGEQLFFVVSPQGDLPAIAAPIVTGTAGAGATGAAAGTGDATRPGKPGGGGRRRRLPCFSGRRPAGRPGASSVHHGRVPPLTEVEIR